MGKCLNQCFLMAGMVLLAAACGESYVYKQSLPVNPQGWRFADTLDFRFSVTDTAARYNLYFEVEHARNFSRQNVYVNLYTKFPDGRRLSKPVSFDLFNARGETNGKCSGDRCRVQLVLQENTRFNQPGEYLITVEQYMRQDSIPGIYQMTFFVQKRESEQGG